VLRNSQHRRISDDEDDDIPSAPPFSGSTQDVRQTHEEIPTSRAHISPNKAESRTLKSMSGDRIENHVESGSPDQFVRLARHEFLTSSKVHDFLVKQCECVTIQYYLICSFLQNCYWLRGCYIFKFTPTPPSNISCKVFHLSYCAQYFLLGCG